MSTGAKYPFLYASMMHASRTELVENVGDIASYLYIKYLCLLSPDNILTFRLPSIFSLRKRRDSRIVFLCYLVKSLLCRGTNVYLIWI